MKKTSDDSGVIATDQPELSTVWDGAFSSRKEDDMYRALASALAREEWPALLDTCSSQLLPLPPVHCVVESADSVDGSWSTVLHQAVCRSAPDSVVNSLLSLGALCSVKDARGRLPWQLAAKNGRPELATRLRRRLPEISLQDKRTEYVFHGLLSSFLLVAAQNVTPERQNIRLPPLIALRERVESRMWFPIMGMMGGFHFWWEMPESEESVLIVEAWSRMDGIIMAWRVTPSQAASSRTP
jgi:hypothetical protein